MWPTLKNHLRYPHGVGYNARSPYSNSIVPQSNRNLYFYIPPAPQLRRKVKICAPKLRKKKKSPITLNDTAEIRDAVREERVWGIQKNLANSVRRLPHALINEARQKKNGLPWLFTPLLKKKKKEPKQCPYFRRRIVAIIEKTSYTRINTLSKTIRCCRNNTRCSVRTDPLNLYFAVLVLHGNEQKFEIITLWEIIHR